eukprot:SM000195S05288  [mRNA]  locus=s195:103874:109153:- [translate_table: standard]
MATAGALTTAELLDHALRAAASPAAAAGPAAEQVMAVVISLLQAAAEETEQVGRRRQRDALVAMRSRFGDVLRMLAACLGGALGSGSCLHPGGRLRLPALQLLLSWLKLDYRWPLARPPSLLPRLPVAPVSPLAAPVAHSGSVHCCPRSSQGVPAMEAGEMARDHPTLWHLLLASLGTAEEPLALDAAVEVLVDLVATARAGPHGEGAARATVDAVLRQRPSLAAAAKEGNEEADDNGGGGVAYADLARGLCQVAAAVAGAFPELLAAEVAACDGALPLSELVLGCAAEPNMGHAAVELAVEFFLALNTVPVAERWPPLRRELYARLLAVLVTKAAYPSDFVSWDGTTEDADSFHRFRDQIAAEGLDACFNLLGSQFLLFVAHTLEGAATWQQAEVALFAVVSVAPSVKGRLLEEKVPGAGSGGGGGKIMTSEDRHACEAFLMQLLTRISLEGGGGLAINGTTTSRAGGLFSSHSLLVIGAARVAGAYAAWLAASPPGPLVEGVLGYLLRALSVQGASSQAAAAFRAVCARCTSQLSSPVLLERLIVIAETACSSGGGPRAAEAVELEDRAAVVEGLARVVATVQPAAQAEAFAARLAMPYLNCAADLAAVDVQSEEAAAALIGQLRLLAVAVRFLEFPLEPSSATFGSTAGAAKHPCLALMEQSWPMLKPLLTLPGWRANASIIEALCEVHSRLFLSVKEGAVAMVPALQPVIELYSEYQYAACLDVLATAVEVYFAAAHPAALSGAPASSGSYSTLYYALKATAVATFALLMRGELADRTDVLAAFFSLMHRYLVFAPSIILPYAGISSLVRAVAAVIEHQERSSSKVALTFLTYLLAPPERALSIEACQRHQPLALQSALSEGKALLASLLFAAGDRLPRDLLRPLAMVLYTLLGAAPPQQAEAWLIGVLSSPNFSGRQGGALSDADCNVFCQVALQRPPLPQPRFEAMVVDFASVCRREGSGDSLLAYQG